MEFYLDTLSITQLKSLLPSVYHRVIEKKICEKQRELEGMEQKQQ